MTDPAAAFRSRARHDRAELLRIGARIGDGAVPDLAELERIAHGLAGAGGVFGHADLSSAALRIERLAERWRAEALAVLSPRRKSLLARALRDLDERLSAANRGVSNDR